VAYWALTTVGLLYLLERGEYSMGQHSPSLLHQSGFQPRGKCLERGISGWENWDHRLTDVRSLNIDLVTDFVEAIPLLV